MLFGRGGLCTVSHDLTYIVNRDLRDWGGGVCHIISPQPMEFTSIGCGLDDNGVLCKCLIRVLLLPNL